MKKKIIFIIYIVLSILILCNCNFTPVQKISDEGDDSSDFEVAESDIVETYGDYIIRLNKQGLDIVYAQNGIITKIAGQTINASSNDDLLLYNDTLIVISSFAGPLYENYNINGGTSNYTEVSFYDLSLLNQSGYNFNAYKTMKIYGNYFTCRIFDNCLYQVNCFSATKESIYNIIYTENGISRTSENFYHLSGEYALSKYNYTSITSVPLEETELKSKSVLIYGTMQEFCIYPYGIFPIFIKSVSSDNGTIGDTTDDYCYFTSTIAKFSLNTLKYVGEICDEGYYVYNRYSLNATNEYIMVASIDIKLGSRLSIYDNAMELVGRIDNIAPGEVMKATRYNDNYCYITTYKQVDPVYKIDISDVSNPVIVDELKVTGYNTYLHLLNNQNLALGFTNEGINLYDISSDDIELIDEVSSYALHWTAMYEDLRTVLLDRENKKLYLVGISYSEEVTNQIEQNENYDVPELAQYYRNLIIISYTDESIFIDKMICDEAGINEDNNIDYNISELSSTRCIISDNYLYIINGVGIKSYNINNQYEFVSEYLY